MKLRLKMEELRVDSFRTAADGVPAKGTVRGNDASEQTCVSAESTCPLACDPGQTGTCQPGWTEVWTSPCCD